MKNSENSNENKTVELRIILENPNPLSQDHLSNPIEWGHKREHVQGSLKDGPVTDPTFAPLRRWIETHDADAKITTAGESIYFIEVEEKVAGTLLAMTEAERKALGIAMFELK